MGWPGVATKYTVSEPVAGVTNLLGEPNKTFGMRFNKYKDIADHMGDYTKAAAPEVTIKAVSHYHTKPVLYEVKTPGETLNVTISRPEIPNAAVSVVRIK
jgi:hypothetical protein